MHTRDRQPRAVPRLQLGAGVQPQGEAAATVLKSCWLLLYTDLGIENPVLACGIRLDEPQGLHGSVTLKIYTR